jgi:hypothetical protein
MGSANREGARGQSDSLPGLHAIGRGRRAPPVRVVRTVATLGRLLDCRPRWGFRVRPGRARSTRRSPEHLSTPAALPDDARWDCAASVCATKRGVVRGAFRLDAAGDRCAARGRRSGERVLESAQSHSRGMPAYEKAIRCCKAVEPKWDGRKLRLHPVERLIRRNGKRLGPARSRRGGAPR